MRRIVRALLLLAPGFFLTVGAMRARADPSPPPAAADSTGTATVDPPAERIRAQIRARQFAAADSAARSLLAGAEARSGDKSLGVARALDLLVEVLYESAKGAEATTYAERAVGLKESILGPAHLETATSLSLLGRVRSQAGNYAQAQEPLQRALSIRERLLGPDHSDVAASLNHLGNLRFSMGHLEESRRLYERSLAIRERQLSPDDPVLAGGLNNLALVLTNMAEYDSAQVIFGRTIAIQEKAFGRENLKVAPTLGNLARVQYRRGDLSEARSTLERALEIYERNSAGEGREAAFSLNYLGLVLQEMGDLAGAKERFERALAIREKASGPEHPNVATSLNSLADLLVEMGDTKRARELLTRALQIREKSLGRDHQNVAVTLQSLANLLRDTGDRSEARPLYGRAIAIWEKAYGPEHHIVAQAIGNLAQLEREDGHPETARPLFERVLRIEKETLGSWHRDVAITLEGLARALADMGEHPGALGAALHCEAIGREHLRLTSHALSETEGLRYAVTRPSGIGLALSLLERDGVSSTNRVELTDSVAGLWDAVIRSRALILDETARRHRSLAVSGDTTITRLHTSLIASSRRLARLMIEGPDDEHPERYRESLERERRAVDAIERELGERSAEFHRELAGSAAGLAEVTSSLPTESALVAFVRYKRPRSAPLHLDHTRPGGYIALVFSKPSARIALIPIGEENEIDALAFRWKTEAAHGALLPGRTPRQSERAYRQTGEALRKRIWDPVASACAGVERVFVVPDGVLSQVSFDALPSGTGYLAESSPRFHYLSAERDLPQMAASVARDRGNLVAIGGPAFDERSLFASLSPRAKPKPTDTKVAATAGSREPNYRGTRSACGEFRNVSFASLPASLREVREVVTLWQKGELESGQVSRSSVPRSVVELTGAAASEGAFKSEAPRAAVLHVATHGFFLGSRCPSALDAARGIGRITFEDHSGPAQSKSNKGRTKKPHVASSRESPLLLSGLAFAGANHRDAASPFEDDGILTAEEIGALDLSGVRLAVLSACDTGAGEIQVGEGVLGLRRAFQVAGAGALVMSLWGVEDRAARGWMRAFYESRWVERLAIDTAVREANVELLGARRRARESTHPFFWGGFVAAGDWR